LAHYRAGRYEDAINNYLAALNCPDKESCTDLPKLIKQALDARVYELNKARNESEAATRRAMANDIIYKAQNENDRTTSFRLAELAWRIDRGNPKALVSLIETVYNHTGPWCDNFIMDAPMQGPGENLVIPDISHGNGIFWFDSIFSPGNKYLITEDHSVWDLESGKVLFKLYEGISGLENIHSLRFSPDGKYIIFESSWYGGNGDELINELSCLDSETGKILLFFRGDDYYSHDVFLEFFPGDNYFIYGRVEEQKAIIRDAYDRKESLTLSGHTASVLEAKFVPDGAHLILSYNDSTAKIWEFSSQESRFDLSPDASPTHAAPFGNYLEAAEGVVTGINRKWPYSSGFKMVFERTDTVFKGAVPQDERWKATFSDEQTLVIMDASTGEKRSTLSVHHGRINSACFEDIRDVGPVVLTASDDQTAVVWNAITGEKIWTLEGHTGPVKDARFVESSGYGQIKRWIATVSEDRTVKIWDTDTQREIWTLGAHKAPVINMWVSPTLEYAITAAADQTVNVWHMATGKLLYSFENPTATPDLAPMPSGEELFARFSPMGDFLLIPSENNTAKIWKWWKGQEFVILEGHAEEITDAAISEYGDWVATASRDHTARVWNTQTGQLKSILFGHLDRVNSVCLRDSTILTSSDDQTANVWNGMSGERLLTLQGHTGKVTDALFSEDGKWILTASDDRTARIWDASTGEELFTLNGHRKKVNSICFAEMQLPDAFVTPDTPLDYNGNPPEIKVAITSSDDRNVMVWNALTGEKLLTLEDHSGKIKDVKFYKTYSEGKTNNILTISDDHTARIWDASSGRRKFALRGHTAPLICAELSLSYRNNYIATASEDRTVKVWNAKTGQLLHSFSVPSARISSIRFSQDDKYIMAASSEGSVMVWPLHPNLGHFGHAGPDFGRGLLLGHVKELMFSPDEKQILSISENFGETLVKAWDVEVEKEVFSKGGNYFSASFSSDGKYLLTTSTDEVGEIFDLETGEKKQSLDSYAFLRLSPDGKQIITGVANEVRVMDSKTGEALYVRIDTSYWEENIINAAFSPSGAFVYLDFRSFCEVWDWRSSSKVFFTELFNGATSTEFSENGDYFCVSEHGSPDINLYFNSTKIKNLKTEKEFPIQDAGFATFSPDSKSVLTIMHLSSNTGSTGIKIWDLKSESEILSFPGKFQTARFSPDGRYILTTSREGPAKVWDSKTGEEILKIAGIVGDSHVQWSQDGKRILAETEDGSIKIYLISGDELIEEATRRFKMGYFTPGQIKLYSLEATFPYAGLDLAKLAAAGEEEKMRSIAAYYELQGDQISNKETSREYYEKAMQFYKAIVPIARRYAPETYQMWIGKVEGKLGGLSGRRTEN
jgi:WD40 repeat protein